MYKLVLIMSCLIWSITTYAYMRDPTRPITASAGSSYAVSSRGIKVGAILIAKNTKLALIGSRYFHIGDEIMGAKIVDIKPYEVRLRDDEGEFDIPFFAQEIKRPVTIKGDEE